MLFLIYLIHEEKNIVYKEQFISFTGVMCQNISLLETVARKPAEKVRAAGQETVVFILFLHIFL